MEDNKSFTTEPEKESGSKGEREVLHGDKYLPDDQKLMFPGPLMSDNLKKEQLMRFIQEKRQECLLHVEEPEQQNCYYFWLIIEPFCGGDAEVMMSDIGRLLLKGYRDVSRKILDVKNQEIWCLALAKLLSSDAGQKKEIVEMGNYFASRGWRFAAHLCFVVAQLKLGSRDGFDLIGCECFPDRKSALREAIERTEVYEYALFLTSGFGQTHFQEFKRLHTFELADAGFSTRALNYCKSITTTLFRVSQSIDNRLIDLALSLSEKINRGREEETEWLKKLHQLQEATQSSNEDETSSCSSENNDFYCVMEEPLRPTERIYPGFEEKDFIYAVGEKLGQGSLATVFSAVRKADGKQVAIKCVSRNSYDKFISIPGQTFPLPVEVALMEIMSKPTCCENVVELLDWFESPTYLYLVMDYPSPCMDLEQFLKKHDHCLHETLAQKIVLQVVQGVLQCCERRVLPRDIRCQNILINTDTLEVKLNDFGCGDLLMDGSYTCIAGSPSIWPPERFADTRYFGVSATVWSLGRLMFQMFCGDMPFDEDNIMYGILSLDPDLSDACCHLMYWCLKTNPYDRPSLNEIQNHCWLDLSRERCQAPDLRGRRSTSVLRRGRRSTSVLHRGHRSTSVLRQWRRSISVLHRGQRSISVLCRRCLPTSVLRRGRRSFTDLSDLLDLCRARRSTSSRLQQVLA